MAHDPASHTGRILNLLRRICKGPALVGLLHAEARLHEDLRADSLDMVMIQMALEEEFAIAISDDEGAALETVGDIVRLVAEKTDPATRLARHGAEGLQP